MTTWQINAKSLQGANHPWDVEAVSSSRGNCWRPMRAMWGCRARDMPSSVRSSSSQETGRSETLSKVSKADASLRVRAAIWVLSRCCLTSVLRWGAPDDLERGPNGPGAFVEATHGYRDAKGCLTRNAFILCFPERNFLVCLWMSGTSEGCYRFRYSDDRTAGRVLQVTASFAAAWQVPKL